MILHFPHCHCRCFAPDNDPVYKDPDGKSCLRSVRVFGDSAAMESTVHREQQRIDPNTGFQVPSEFVLE